MKLVVITANIDYEDAIKKLFLKTQVKNYSFQSVLGVSLNHDNNTQSNWFASEPVESDSYIYFCFVNDNQAIDLFESIEAFNLQDEFISKIHIAILPIDKLN